VSNDLRTDWPESEAFKPPLANIRTLADSIDHEPAALW
jgi:hypothetical protein